MREVPGLTRNGVALAAGNPFTTKPIGITCGEKVLAYAGTSLTNKVSNDGSVGFLDRFFR